MGGTLGAGAGAENCTLQVGRPPDYEMEQALSYKGLHVMALLLHIIMNGSCASEKAAKLAAQKLGQLQPSTSRIATGTHSGQLISLRPA